MLPLLSHAQRDEQLLTAAALPTKCVLFSTAWQGEIVMLFRVVEKVLGSCSKSILHPAKTDISFQSSTISCCQHTQQRLVLPEQQHLLLPAQHWVRGMLGMATDCILGGLNCSSFRQLSVN